LEGKVWDSVGEVYYRKGRKTPDWIGGRGGGSSFTSLGTRPERKSQARKGRSWGGGGLRGNFGGTFPSDEVSFFSLWRKILRLNWGKGGVKQTRHQRKSKSGRSTWKSRKGGSDDIALLSGNLFV